MKKEYMDETLQKFVDRVSGLKAKTIFKLRLINKPTAYEFIKENHYLGDAKFFAVDSVGLYYKDELIGVAAFSLPQGNVALKGWFGLPNTDKTVYELSRLAVIPELNGSNATSFLLRGSIKLLKHNGIRAVITLADSSRHVGSIYQVCGFTYYGLTDSKSDFFRYDGKKNPRGSTKNTKGVWLPRTRKHRYAVILDESLECLYEEVPNYPRRDETQGVPCCNGTHRVTDNRFGDTYTCPYCTERLSMLEDDIEEA